MSEPTRRLRRGANPILVMREYGCVKCQLYHEHGDELYEAHAHFMSKHGIRERFLEEIILPKVQP